VYEPIVFRPHRVDGAEDLVHIAMGSEFAVAERSDGATLGWGNNAFFPLGDRSGGVRPEVISEIAGSPDLLVAGGATTGFILNGAVEYLGVGFSPSARASPVVRSLPGGNNAIGMTFVSWTACLPTSDGSIRCLGENVNGILGTPNGPNNFGNAQDVPGLPAMVSVALGEDLFACAVSISGDVWCWGNDRYGSLGARVQPAPVILPPGVVSGLPAVDDIALGAAHACAKTKDGELFCWGYNAAGELGLGFASDMVATPTQVAGIGIVRTIAAGDDHTCVINTDDQLFCWGINTDGELGVGESVVESSSEPQRVQLEAGTQ
jgi:alpha-tubulin suppressor-like RCC1 family protein